MSDYRIIRKQRLEAARAQGTHSVLEWELMKLFFKICVKCEGTSGYYKVNKDHIVPLYKGGSDSIENIQPLCAGCNSSKTGDTTDYRKSFIKRHNLMEFSEFMSSFRNHIKKITK